MPSSIGGAIRAVVELSCLDGSVGVTMRKRRLSNLEGVSIDHVVVYVLECFADPTP